MGGDSFDAHPIGRTFLASVLVDSADFFLSLVPASQPVAGETKGKKPGAGDKRPPASKLGAKLTDAELAVDHYAILELGRGDRSTEDEVRAAYKRLAVTTHPDKMRGDDTAFKAVQLAFEILSDPAKKRTFDSAAPFDESAPDSSTIVPEKDFYKVFSPVFARNSKWSAKGAPPVLGDASTSDEDVKKFYAFWLSFKTWRTFDHELEIDVDEGDERAYRRWATRQRERETEKKRAIELRRVRAFVEHAQRSDPRWRAIIRREEAAAAEAKLAKAEAARIAKENAAAAAKAAADAKAAAEAAERAAKQERQEKMKASRKRLAALVRPFEGSAAVLSDSAVAVGVLQFLRERLTMEQLDSLSSTLEGMLTAAGVPLPAQEGGPAPSADFFKLINETLQATEKAAGEDRFGRSLIAETVVMRSIAKEATAASAEQAAADAKPWDPTELRNLTKLLKQFPVGVSERWATVAMELGTGRSAKAIIAKTRELDDLRLRPSALSDAAASIQLTVSDAKVRGAGEEGARAPKAAPVSAAAAATDAAWTAKQQDQLQNALRELKAYSGKDKFIKVAEMVEGKNARQCFNRYKYLQEQVKK